MDFQDFLSNGRNSYPPPSHMHLYITYIESWDSFLATLCGVIAHMPAVAKRQ